MNLIKHRLNQNNTIQNILQNLLTLFLTQHVSNDPLLLNVLSPGFLRMCKKYEHKSLTNIRIIIMMFYKLKSIISAELTQKKHKNY